MFHFNIIDIMTLTSYFFLPLVRILAFLSISPIFNEKIVNNKIKFILAACITFLIAPFLPKIHLSLFSSVGLILFLHQILIGCALGFIIQFLFITANLAGEIISLQIGLSFATFFDMNTHLGTSIISRLLNIYVLFFFLALNGHLQVINILVNSFYAIPIDENYLYANIFLIILKFSGYIFIHGITLSLPIIIFLLALNIVMGIINRLSPQISIFSMGLSLNLLIGISLLYNLIMSIFPFLKNIFNELMLFIGDIF
ncbi:flagellar biosynthetic protein FliR [Buchnera aphidicola]|uniref:flagellar biosynthetic protein FliR n=1 Tax=Buchnera aphidicola TaxID=9 RepID=UPI0034642F46